MRVSFGIGLLCIKLEVNKKRQCVTEATRSVLEHMMWCVLLEIESETILTEYTA